MSVQCIELLHRGERATGASAGICTYAATHRGVEQAESVGIVIGVVIDQFYRPSKLRSSERASSLKSGEPSSLERRDCSFNRASL